MMDDSRLFRIALLKTFLSIVLTVCIVSIFPDLPISKVLSRYQRLSLWIIVIFGGASSLFGIMATIAIKNGRKDLLGYSTYNKKVYNLNVLLQFLFFFLFIGVMFALLMIINLKLIFDVNSSFKTELFVGAVYSFPASLAFCLYVRMDYISMDKDELKIHNWFFFKEIKLQKHEIQFFEIRRTKLFNTLIFQTARARIARPLLINPFEISKLEESLKQFLT